MKSFKILIGSDFLLLIALLFFFDFSSFILSCIPPIFVHELGHVLAMRMYGIRPVRLRASLAGFSLDYDGVLSGSSEAISALAGPFCGLVFAFICSLLGKIFMSDFLLFTSGIGVVINIFNLLPALPLDGGRALRGLILRFKWGDSLICVMGIFTCSVLIAAGLYFISYEQGWAVFIIGICLLLMQVKA